MWAHARRKKKALFSQSNIWQCTVYMKNSNCSLTLKFCWINYTAFGQPSNTLPLSRTSTRTRTQKHMHADVKWILFMWKALGNEGEACLCFHKQLQRFHPTAYPGGGWLAGVWELPPVVCSLVSLYFADEADSDRVVWTLSAFCDTMGSCSGVVESMTLCQTGVRAAQCVSSPHRIVFASDLHWNQHQALELIQYKYEPLVSHAATKDSNTTDNHCKRFHSHHMFTLLLDCHISFRSTLGGND